MYKTVLIFVIKHLEQYHSSSLDHNCSTFICIANWHWLVYLMQPTPSVEKSTPAIYSVLYSTAAVIAVPDIKLAKGSSFCIPGNIWPLANNLN